SFTGGGAAAARGGTVQRTPNADAQPQRGTIAQHWQGVTSNLSAKLSALMGNLPNIIKDTLWGLIWPWPGVIEDVTGLWNNLQTKVGSLEGVDTGSIEGFIGSVQRIFSTLSDIPLLIWRAVNSIAGRLSLWFAIASVVAGAVIGAFFGGVGALPGALAGAKVALAAGQGILASFVAAEITNILKAAGDLIAVPQTPEEQNEDYSNIADSAIALGITGLLALLSSIASRLAGAVRAFISRIHARRTGGNTPPTQEPAPQTPQPPAPRNPGRWEVVNESMSPRAAAYQTQITGRPANMSYRVNGVKFDGYTNGTLLDAKGPGYANFVRRDGTFQPWYDGLVDLPDQAARQLNAAGNTPIVWHVAEERAADAMRALLNENGYGAIKVVHTPAQ
ncbi:MAG TPA: Tox-REase-5 domain-containing protein, partial [Herpetosiphonaceae bacterium]